jgi:ornithine carbamoyltransferase
MGQEYAMHLRAQVFAPYRVTENLMAAAAPDALFMHCLPAHRGQEVADEVIDSKRSLVFDQAENRLHVQKALLLLLLQNGR